MISRFRAALEDRGIDTGSWWQQQLDLCMIGIMATFSWEKALGDAGELSGGRTRSPMRSPASAFRFRDSRGRLDEARQMTGEAKEAAAP